MSSGRTMHHLGTLHFSLLYALVQRIDRTGVDPVVRHAVDVLTHDVAPERADRLAVRAQEPAVVVERLAVWALHRASDAAVMAARRLLAAEGEGEVAA